MNNDCSVHRRILQSIYVFMTKNPTCSRYGTHWEEVGFQVNANTYSFNFWVNQRLGSSCEALSLKLVYMTGNWKTPIQALHFTVFNILLCDFLGARSCKWSARCWNVWGFTNAVFKLCTRNQGCPCSWCLWTIQASSSSVSIGCS